MSRSLLPAVGLLGVALLAGCGGSAAETPAAPATAQSGAPAGAPSCPPPGPTTLQWPEGIPEDLPKPAGAVHTSTSRGADGLVLVRFSTDQSLRTGVVGLVRDLQPAGYTLGRGDAEAAEADAPFTRGPVRGIYRLIARQPCATDWLVAVTRTSGGPGSGPTGPLLPPPTGAATPSPLPFG